MTVEMVFFALYCKRKIKVDIKKFKEHLDEYHLNGSSIHEENGHYFTVDQKFRNKINSLYEQE